MSLGSDFFRAVMPRQESAELFHLRRWENEDGTTNDVIVLPELPRRKNKTCRSQGKCKAKDFCPFDHENVEEQRQLYSAVAAAAASASHSGIQRMIQ